MDQRTIGFFNCWSRKEAFIKAKGMGVSYPLGRFTQGSNISTIGSLSLCGVGPTMSVEGAVDTQVFDAYVEKFLVPSLLPGDIVLLDNVKFHYSERSLRLIEAAGARVKHIPAYSPDFSPIEDCISKIKGALRKAKARTERKLLNTLGRIIEKVAVDAESLRDLRL